MESLGQLVYTIRRYFILLVILFVLGACKKDKRKFVFHQDFSQGNQVWQTAHTLLDKPESPNIDCWISWESKYACTMYAPVTNGEVVLKTPFWLDSNHAPPGAGYLNLMLWAYLKDIFKDPSKTIDLRNKTLLVDIRGNMNMKESKLVFWFQTRSSDGKSANFAYTGHPIPLNKGSVAIKLTTNPNDWVCLGSASDKTGKYECASLEESMAKVTVDIGLILFPVAGNPDPGMQPEGEIVIKAIGIY